MHALPIAGCLSGRAGHRQALSKCFHGTDDPSTSGRAASHGNRIPLQDEFQHDFAILYLARVLKSGT